MPVCLQTDSDELRATKISKPRAGLRLPCAAHAVYDEC
jgi:hypothetical protein